MLVLLFLCMLAESVLLCMLVLHKLVKTCWFFRFMYYRMRKRMKRMKRQRIRRINLRAAAVRPAQRIPLTLTPSEGELEQCKPTDCHRPCELSHEAEPWSSSALLQPPWGVFHCTISSICISHTPSFCFSLFLTPIYLPGWACLMSLLRTKRISKFPMGNTQL